MAESILTSTKEKLGVVESYTVFDGQIIDYINSAFSTLHDLGVGPINGFAIEDELEEWDDLDLPDVQLRLVKTYIGLKARLLFDPPSTSFHLEAMNKQIAEHEWRLNVQSERASYPLTNGVLENYP